MPAIDDLVDLYAERMDRLTVRAARGEITVGEWVRGMREAIRDAHNTAAIIGRDYRPMNLLQRGWLWAQRQVAIASNYGYLRRWSDQIYAGKLDNESLLGVLRARARMYAGSARGTHSAAQTQVHKEMGRTEERWVLGDAEHCPDCEALAAMGWVPIGTHPEPGTGATQCLTNCRCHKEYR